MKRKIGLIHATLNAVLPMNEALRRYMPGVEILNFLDEGLIADLNHKGKITPPLLRRFIRLIEKAEEAGVDGALLTCSSFTPHVQLAGQLFEFPVISVDYAMLEEAVTRGNSIAVIATVVSAAPITMQILQEIANEQGKEIDIYTTTITEAFAALQAGKEEEHNRLIREKIVEVSKQYELIVLAQISMSRAVEGFDLPGKTILTSPESSIKSLMDHLEKS
ncbi:aspartate/glutamate racemase family protein [Paenibacillus illinoisensis]|uniref:aspartate/glutamate racemase family protein n=1 Tax=Paenibacillus illinoisensis TaxID=59845 RepID=UPI003D2E9822